jgi:hypothetical protein
MAVTVTQPIAIASADANTRVNRGCDAKYNFEALTTIAATNTITRQSALPRQSQLRASNANGIAFAIARQPQLPGQSDFRESFAAATAIADTRVKRVCDGNHLCTTKRSGPGKNNYDGSSRFRCRSRIDVTRNGHGRRNHVAIATAVGIPFTTVSRDCDGKHNCAGCT